MCKQVSGPSLGTAASCTDEGAGPLVSAEETKPLAEHLDQLERPMDLGSSAPGLLGGAFSFACVVRMDSFNHWCRVFDFSNVEADCDSITAGAVGLTRDLHFTVFRRKQPFSVTVHDFFEPGREFTMLCTVSGSGHMRVLKDGVLVGESPHGAAPLPKPRPRMVVGGHFKFRAQVFRGSLRGVRMWDREISWADAARD